MLTLASVASLGGTVTFSGAGTLKVSQSLTFGISSEANIEMSAGGLLWLTENSAVTGSSSYRGIWNNNRGSLTVDAGSSIDFVEAGRTGIVNIDALNGGGVVRGSYHVAAENRSPTVLNLGVANGSGSFSGSIKNGANNTGNGSFLSVVKDGSGTQVLSGVSTYTGPTTISGGSLILGAGGTTGSLATFSSLVTNGMLGFNR